jgi:hypothetical protein
MIRTNAWRLRAAAVLAAVLLPSAASAQTVVVQPYVQPGDGRTLTGTDVKVISWLTDQQPGGFLVEYQLPFGPIHAVKPTRLTLDFPALKKGAKDPDPDAKKDGDGDKDPKQDKEAKVPLPPEKDQHYYKYTAYLENLPFNSEVRYRVRLGDVVIREGTFKTRATADKATRCVLVGDMAQGRDAQKPVAYQISKHNPDFLVALGDIVYPTGRMNQYMAFFWNTYNNLPEAHPKAGAPLMASVPFYPVLGNHDISAKLATVPDALAAYYLFCPPKSGPGEGPWATKLTGDDAVIAKFRTAARDSYPNMDAYSFDYGPAHFVVFNDNKGLAIDAPEFRKWLLTDLKTTTAKWKFVCFHVPGFQSSVKHYTEQQIRPLQPLFEEGGVDITFAGHVHNYQRTVPLKFAPEPTKDKKGRVNGQFTLDKTFDGVTNTQPVGVIHIVAGGGGAGLYGPGLDKTADLLKKDHGANYADYTARMVADEHSFVVLDIAPDRLDLRAVGAKGNELDRISITRGK